MSAAAVSFTIGKSHSAGSLYSRTVGKSNPCHVPSGPKGGQFCSTQGAVAPGDIPATAIGPDQPMDANVDALVHNGWEIDQYITSKYWNAKADRERGDAIDAKVVKLEKFGDSLLHRYHKALNEDTEHSTPESKARLDKLSLQMDKHATRLGNAYKEQSDYRKDLAVRGHFVEGFNHSVSPTGEIAWSHDLAWKEGNWNDWQQSDQGMRWLSRMVGDGKISSSPNVSPASSSSYYGTTRSYCQGSNIVLVKGEGAATVAHEAGHWIEHNRNDVYMAATRFLERRYESSASFQKEIQPLSKITGNDAYLPHEVAFKDKFREPYVGKVYNDQSGRVYATEVVSMGVEKLYRSPAKFRAEDPEYYHFTLGVLHHVAKTSDTFAGIRAPEITSFGRAALAAGGKP